MNIELLYQMEMIRKRRIGGYSPATGYRTTDLVVHLDAIQNTRINGHVSDASVWENLANKFDVTLYNATWGKNYCSFSGNTGSYGIGDYWNFTKGTTVEVVFSSIGNGAVQAIAGWTSDHPTRFNAFIMPTRKTGAISFSGNTLMENSNVIVDNAIQHVGFSLGFSIFNGSSESESATEWKKGNANLIKFKLAQWILTPSYNPSYPLLGNIYAVRVYDANLTANELYAHWLIDKKRFNIPEE